MHTSDYQADDCFLSLRLAISQKHACNESVIKNHLSHTYETYDRVWFLNNLH